MTGVPSANLPAGFSLNVQTLPFSLGSHDSAAAGRHVLGLKRVKRRQASRTAPARPGCPRTPACCTGRCRTLTDVVAERPALHRLVGRGTAGGSVTGGLLGRTTRANCGHESERKHERNSLTVVSLHVPASFPLLHNADSVEPAASRERLRAPAALHSTAGAPARVDRCTAQSKSRASCIGRQAFCIGTSMNGGYHRIERTDADSPSYGGCTRIQSNASRTELQGLQDAVVTAPDPERSGLLRPFG